MKLYFKIIGIVALIVVAIIGAKVFLAPLFLANTVVTAASSTTKGIVQKTLNADNALHNYEWFHDVHQSFGRRLGDIEAHAAIMAEVKGEGDKEELSRLRIEHAGIRQTCRDLAAKYNSNSEKMNTSIFKGWSLPDNLNAADCG